MTAAYHMAFLGLQVIAYYDFLEEFKVSAPEEEVAAARCMNVAYTALKEETMVAEGAKDRQSQVGTFRTWTICQCSHAFQAAALAEYGVLNKGLASTQLQQLMAA